MCFSRASIYAVRERDSPRVARSIRVLERNANRSCPRAARSRGTCPALAPSAARWCCARAPTSSSRARARPPSKATAPRWPRTGASSQCARRRSSFAAYIYSTLLSTTHRRLLASLSWDMLTRKEQRGRFFFFISIYELYTNVIYAELDMRGT